MTGEKKKGRKGRLSFFALPSTYIMHTSRRDMLMTGNLGK